MCAEPSRAMAEEDLEEDVETLLVYYESQEPEYATEEKAHKVIRSFRKKAAKVGPDADWRCATRPLALCRAPCRPAALRPARSPPAGASQGDDVRRVRGAAWHRSARVLPPGARGDARLVGRDGLGPQPAADRAVLQRGGRGRGPGPERRVHPRQDGRGALVAGRGARRRRAARPVARDRRLVQRGGNERAVAAGQAGAVGVLAGQHARPAGGGRLRRDTAAGAEAHAVGGGDGGRDVRGARGLSHGPVHELPDVPRPDLRREAAGGGPVLHDPHAEPAGALQPPGRERAGQRHRGQPDLRAALHHVRQPLARPLLAAKSAHCCVGCAGRWRRRRSSARRTRPGCSRGTTTTSARTARRFC